jgi:hypothetical protein
LPGGAGVLTLTPYRQRAQTPPVRNNGHLPIPIGSAS